MNSQAQQSTGKLSSSPNDSPEQRRDDDSQQAFRAAPRADGGDHRVKQP